MNKTEKVLQSIESQMTSSVAKDYRVNYRTSCAGCDVDVWNAEIEAILIKYDGYVGEVTDKSIELIFTEFWDRAGFVIEAQKFNAVFDPYENDVN